MRSRRGPPHGEIDALTAPRLGRRLLDLAEEGKRLLVVDLSAVTFMDSTGISVILNALRHPEDAQRQPRARLSHRAHPAPVPRSPVSSAASDLQLPRRGPRRAGRRLAAAARSGVLVAEVLEALRSGLSAGGGVSFSGCPARSRSEPARRTGDRRDRSVPRSPGRSPRRFTAPCAARSGRAPRRGLLRSRCPRRSRPRPRAAPWAGSRSRRATPGGSALDRGEPAAAVGAVVQVLLDELPRASTRRGGGSPPSRELAGGRSERQQCPDHAELLAGVAVDVGHPGLDLADDLAVRAGTQSVLLAGWHGAEQ